MLGDQSRKSGPAGRFGEEGELLFFARVLDNAVNKFEFQDRIDGLQTHARRCEDLIGEVFESQYAGVEAGSQTGADELVADSRGGAAIGREPEGPIEAGSGSIFQD